MKWNGVLLVLPHCKEYSWWRKHPDSSQEHLFGYFYSQNCFNSASHLCASACAYLFRSLILCGFLPLEQAKIGHLMKLTNLYLASKKQCLKALAFPTACTSHYPIYPSLLGEFTHSWSMLAVYQLREHGGPTRCCAGACAETPMITACRPQRTFVLQFQATFYFVFLIRTDWELNFDI